ncbi:MAG: chloride channel protein [Ruminococcaceae bacterium]|nr:chloride channel protein [Oscillospiraceae bacterium]
MLNSIKTNLKFSTDYVLAFLKWTVLSVFVGLIGGVLGSVFHICIDRVTELRMEHGFLLFLLPLGGLLIAAMYHLFSSKGRIDTNRVIESVRENEKVPLVMIPLIFISTVITHMLGGSAGREGAALQLGGSVGYNVGKLLRLNEKSMRIIIMSGMSSVFAALFGTPLTAAVFSIEVISVGVLHYAGLVPCVTASVVAYTVSRKFGLGGVRFDNVVMEQFAVSSFAKVAILALLCALVSILFCAAIKKCEHLMDRMLRNRYLRTFIGGLIIALLSLILNTRDYNGAGMDVITRAMNGETGGAAFLLKIIFTAITISAGFKGGEIVPAFFIGSTFGCVLAPLLGLNPSFAAAIGFVALFCGVVNCPVASIILSIEVFGAEGLLFFALACSISYMMSGCFGLYHSQKIVYSKLDDEYIDINTI